MTNVEKKDDEGKRTDWTTGAGTGISEDPYPLYRLPPLTPAEAEEYMRAAGCSEPGIRIMKDKFRHIVVKVPGLTAREALILKQNMLSIGGEVAVNENVLRDLENVGDVLIEGTHAQLRELSVKLRGQPFNLSSVGYGLRNLLETTGHNRNIRYMARSKEISFPPARIMGILNVTPDSFSDGGVFFEFEKAVDQANEMIAQGADIIDVGGESTRPFSEPLTVKEETDRVIPVIEELRKSVDCVISVDTYKSEVAQQALEAGAHIVNDVYALQHSGDMAEVIAQYDAGVVLMHMKGTPSDMQVEPSYGDVIGEISQFLRERSNAALEAGIPPDRIMVDPGIGFGKRLRDNLEIIRNICAFFSLGYPVLVGPSRKRFIGDITGRPVTDRVGGTVAVSALAVQAGADVLRVHDVGEVVQGIKMAEAVMNHIDHR